VGGGGPGYEDFKKSTEFLSIEDSGLAFNLKTLTQSCWPDRIN
jgi:hypothetical protein